MLLDSHNTEINYMAKKTTKGFTHESTYNESKEWYTPGYLAGQIQRGFTIMSHLQRQSCSSKAGSMLVAFTKHDRIIPQLATLYTGLKSGEYYNLP
jgi:hypothetical protein